VLQLLVFYLLLWGFLSWLFPRWIPSPIPYLTRAISKVARAVWGVVYTKPARQRGVGFGIFCVLCLLYALLVLAVIQRGEGYDRLFFFGLAIGLYKFCLDHWARWFRSQRNLPRRQPRRRRR
jgi:hypothetical protein